MNNFEALKGITQGMKQWQRQFNNLTKIDYSPVYSSIAMLANTMNTYSSMIEQINNNLKIWNQAIYSEVFDSMNNFNNMMTTIQKSEQSLFLSYNKALRSMKLSMNAVFQQLQNSQASFNDISKLYSDLENQFNSNGALSDDEVSVDLTNDDKEQIANAVKEVISSNPNTWNQTATSKINSLSTMHPKIAKAVFWFLLFILQYFLSKSFDLIGETITKASVKERPAASSQVITVIENQQQIIILDNKPYYYQIKFTDEKTGDTYKGWISKRSIKAIRSDSLKR